MRKRRKIIRQNRNSTEKKIKNFTYAGKWSSDKGESLGEILAAFLLSVLALLLLSTMLLSSGKLLLAAKSCRTSFYQAFNAIEKGGGTPEPAKLRIEGSEIPGLILDIEIYRDEEKGFWAYEAAG